VRKVYRGEARLHVMNFTNFIVMFIIITRRLVHDMSTKQN